MAKLSLWNAKKKNDYRFFDRTIGEMFQIGGTAFLVHKFLGTTGTTGSDDLTLPNYPDNAATNIGDLLLLENRDRNYDENLYELRGSYNVQDNEFDLSQFGLMLSNDTLFITFHINDMIDILGRKLMPGDVLELPHLKDDTLLDDSDDGINDYGVLPKLYKIDDTNRASEGFSPTWWPHIWRVKMSPLADSQEYEDILGKTLDEFGGEGDVSGGATAGDNSPPGSSGTTFADVLSTGNTNLAISDAIIAEAERQVPNRNLEHSHLYVDENHEDGTPYLFLTDGCPPNGEPIAGEGSDFPLSPDEGEWFLRTDYEPAVLYKREGPKWVRKEAMFRRKWTTASRSLITFINNRKKISRNNKIIESKVGVSKIIEPQVPKPKIDEDYVK